MDLDPQTQPRPVRSPVWRRVWQTLAVIAVVLAGLYTYQYVTKGRFWQGTFERYVSKRAGRPVRVTGDFQLYLHPDLKFHAEGLSVANPGWSHDPQLFTARTIDLDLSIWRLLFGEQRITHLLIDGGRLGLERDAQGRNSWTFPGDTALTIPAIDRADITDTRLAFIDALRRANIAIRFGDVSAANKRIGAPLAFAGSGTAYGAPFVLNGTLTTPDASIAGGRLGLKLHAEAVQTQIDVAGNLPGVTRIDDAPLDVTIAGRNLQAPGRLFGIVLPATRPYRLNAVLTKTGRDYQFAQMTGRIGSSDVAGDLRVTTPADVTDRYRINGKVHSKVLDILDVGPLIGYSPEKLDAQGGKGAITTVGGHPRVLPDAPLAVEQLKFLDAHIDYTADHVRTGTVNIDAVTLGFYLENSRLDLDPLDLTLAGGQWTSVIRIDARQRPVTTDYDIRLAAVPLGKLLTSFKVEDSGTTATMRGRIQLHGLGDTLHKSLASANGRIAFVFPKGTFWVRNIELAKLDLQNFVTALIGKRLKKPTEIRCGLAAFTVRDGIGRTDPVLFDTTRATCTGVGQFSFADESLDLHLRGKSKEFSLFSGQSPIGIGGWFAAPSINPISGQLVTRAGAGIALGVVASPLAAVLAFVDFGTEKSNDCGPVLAAAPADAQHKLGKPAAK